jgi:hypothetical protein
MAACATLNGQQLTYVYFENEPPIAHVLVITKNTNQ